MIQFVKNKWKVIILYLFFAGIIIFLLSNKLDFHGDEMWTYNLANATRQFWPESGVEFTPAAQPYLDHHTANDHIDLANVWARQAEDCHPPFYYVLVHLICSLFPHKFNIFYAGTVNIIFQMLLLFVVRKFIDLFTEDEKIKWVISISYVLSAGILTISTFLRMYVMVMFFTTLFLYTVLNKIESFTKKDFFKLFAIAVCGTMTQYYFIVFLVYLSAVLGIILLCNKRYRETVCYVISMVMTAIVSYIIFPAMIFHIFKGERGSGTFKHFAEKEFLERFVKYNKQVNSVLFGGLMWVILLFVAVVLIVNCIKAKKDADYGKGFDKIEKYRYFCIFIPTALYIITIYKTAPWLQIRYVSPVFAVFLVGTLCMLSKCFDIILKKSFIPFAAACLVIVALSLVQCKWEFLYLERKEALQNAETYGKNAEALCIYNDFGLITPDFMEISRCKSSIYFGAKDYAEYEAQSPQLSEDKDLALFIMKDVDTEFLNDFMKNNPQYELVLDNGEFGFGHSYYFSLNK